MSRESRNASRETDDLTLTTHDSGLRTQDSGLKTLDSGLRTQDSGLRAHDFKDLPLVGHSLEAVGATARHVDAGPGYEVFHGA